MVYPHQYPDQIDDRLRTADTASAELFAAIIGEQRHCPSRIARLIAAEAWTDTALALIEQELPQWRVRRLAYDDGAWHCALSRQRELPDWLDQAIESHHADLPLAILSALVEARGKTAPANTSSVPTVRSVTPAYDTMCCENFA
jgi:hypothetical protein